MSNEIPFWAKEQLKLRRTLDRWVTEEIDKYEAEGFDKLFGEKKGHGLDEAGGYTREFVAAYCLSGDKRIAAFLKRFRDDWHAAVQASGHFYHGYDSNEGGDYVTHTAEAFSQFLLNVLYLDPSDATTVAMIEDAAEHVGNYSPDVHDWYDWDNHLFLTYFPGTKRSDFYGPPWNFQGPTHFRLLAIAVAAYDVTGDRRYLDVATDYADMWAAEILAAETEDDLPVTLYPFSEAEAEAAYERFRPADVNAPRESLRGLERYWFSYLKEKLHRGRPRRIGDLKAAGAGRYGPHDPVMTWLEIYRHEPKETYAEALRRMMAAWVGWAPDPQVSQVAGIDPHCGVHLPKYRDVTGDTSLDEVYLRNWPEGLCSYLLTGDEDRLLGAATAAEAVFSQTLMRNAGRFSERYVCTHACNALSNAGASSAYVAPALFMPVFGGLNVHYGRAPWVNVLYYTDGEPGLPADVAALYVPPADGHACGVRLVNAGSDAHNIAVRRVDMTRPQRLVLTAPAGDGAVEARLAPRACEELTLEAGEQKT